MNSSTDRESDPGESHTRPPAGVQWSVGLVLLLLLYILAWPIVYLTGYDVTLPDFVEEALDLSIIPLEVLYDVFSPYENYIDWLENVIAFL